MSDPKQSSRSDEELLANAIPISGEDEGDEDELDKVDLVEAEDDDDSKGASKIRAFGQSRPVHEKTWQRQPNADGSGATHVKTFVAKLRLDAMEHLDEMINDWLDQHPELEVKFVTTSVGDLKGKTTEPALFMNVWV